MLRAEFDFASNSTAWRAYGMRHGDESTGLANLNVDAQAATTVIRRTVAFGDMLGAWDGIQAP